MKDLPDSKTTLRLLVFKAIAQFFSIMVKVHISLKEQIAGVGPHGKTVGYH